MAKPKRALTTARADHPPGTGIDLKLKHVHAKDVFVGARALTVTFVMKEPNESDKMHHPNEQEVTITVEPFSYFKNATSRVRTATAGYYDRDNPIEFEISPDAVFDRKDNPVTITATGVSLVTGEKQTKPGIAYIKKPT